MNILEQIMSKKSELPKKQQQLCNYLLDHYSDIQVSTVKTLAENANIGTTTVLRLVENLGYDSYTDFKLQFHQLQNEYINRWDDVKESFSSNTSLSHENTVEFVLNESVNMLNENLTPELIVNFTQAIEPLINSDKIYIFGSRPYKSAAIYFELLLSEFSNKILQLSNDGDSAFDKVLHSTRNDSIILFGFEPYTKRSHGLAQLAYENHSNVILITDSLSCPIAEFSTHPIILSTSKKYFSIMPVFALIEALVVEIGKRTSPTALNTLEKLSPILKKMDVIF